MSDMALRLPAGFEALEPFVELWAIAGSNDRARVRLEQGEAGCRAFYDAAKDLIAPALNYLDGRMLVELDPAARRLMNLVLGFAHASLAAEIQRDHEARHAVDVRHLPITRSTADAGA